MNADKTPLWNRGYFSYFFDQRQPHVVKHEMERRCGVLLDRETDQVSLTYCGDQTYWWLQGHIELRLEGSDLNRTLYSVRFDAARNNDIFDEARFIADSERAFNNWLRDMHVTQDAGSIARATGERYEMMVAAALEFEGKQAAIKEDPVAVAAAQEAVLSAFRSGKGFGRADHEGATYIRIEDGVLVKRRIGEDPSLETYATREEMLEFLRAFFDWEARRDTLPHKPPEAEIWKFIGYQLR